MTSKEDKLATFPYVKVRHEMARTPFSDKKSRALADALREYATPGKWIDLTTLTKRLQCSFYYGTVAVNILMAEGVVERRPPCVYYFTEKGARRG